MPKLLASIAAAKIADSFLFIENSLLLLYICPLIYGSQP